MQDTGRNPVLFPMPFFFFFEPKDTAFLMGHGMAGHCQEAFFISTFLHQSLFKSQRMPSNGAFTALVNETIRVCFVLFSMRKSGPYLTTMNGICGQRAC
jgi:hypothetical protein